VGYAPLYIPHFSVNSKPKSFSPSELSHRERFCYSLAVTKSYIRLPEARRLTTRFMKVDACPFLLPACFLAVFAAPQSEPGLTRSG
jgi:hypothetical protein